MGLLQTEPTLLSELLPARHSAQQICSFWGRLNSLKRTSSRSRAGPAAPPPRLPGTGARTQAQPPSPLRDAAVRGSARACDVTAGPRVARRPPRPAARWRRCPPAETPPLRRTHAAIARPLGQSARQARSRGHARLLSNNQRRRACPPARPGGLWPQVGSRSCQSARLRAALAADWLPWLSISAEGAGRVWCGRAAGPPRRWLWGRAAPAPQVGSSLRAGLRRRPRPWRPRGSCAEKRRHCAPGPALPSGRGWGGGGRARPAPLRLPRPVRPGCPGLVAALAAALLSRPAASAPGAGRGSQERGRGRWSCPGDRCGGKGSSELSGRGLTGVTGSCSVRPPARSAAEFPSAAVGEKVF